MRYCEHRPPPGGCIQCAVAERDEQRARADKREAELAAVAAAYGTTPEEIAEANQMTVAEYVASSRKAIAKQRDAAIERAERAERERDDLRGSYESLMGLKRSLAAENAKHVAERDAARRDLDPALRFIGRLGYRRCDIAACNCGSWHGGQPGYVRAERLVPVREKLRGSLEIRDSINVREALDRLDALLRDAGVENG